MYLTTLKAKAANFVHLSRKSECSSWENFVLEVCPAGRHVLQIGNGHARIVGDLKRNFCHVTERVFAESSRPTGSTSAASALPENVAWFDRILLLDLVEQLPDPETFMETLREKMARCGSEVIVTASNARSRTARFVSTLFKCSSNRNGNGTSRVGRRHSFTFKSLCLLLERAGYEILEARGVSAPRPSVIKQTARGRALAKLDQLLLKASKHLFSDQICLRVRPVAAGRRVFQQSATTTMTLHPQALGRVA